MQSGGPHDARARLLINAPPVAKGTFRIAIDVRVDGEEIGGSAHREGGESRPFMGWLGLIAALDRLLDCRSLTDEPAVRVCVAFASADEASAFATSAALRDAVLAARTESAPEIWFTHAQSDPSGP